jgi:multicomponent Na+:H+ antiporter subunit D
VYLGILLSTSVGFLLFAILWTWQLTGTLEFRPGGILAGKVDGLRAGVLLALFAFGIGKAALMPFHRWLPAAMVAPTPVSALLHAVAVVKAGVFAVLKVAVYVFGLDFLAAGDRSLWLMYVAAATILIGSLVALRQDNLKARLAYSTVSQLGYIVLGAALATSSAVLGAGLHIAMHAAGKITLFFCAGAIDVATQKKKVSELDGIGRRMPFTMAAFALGSLSIIGLPPFGGAWSKWYLVLGAAESGHVVFVAVLMLSSLLSLAYLMPIVARAFFSDDPENAPAGVREAPLLCVVPLCLTALAGPVLFFLAPALERLLAPLGGP